MSTHREEDTHETPARPALPAQETYARKLGLPIQDAWTAGDISDAISAVVGEWYD